MQATFFAVSLLIFGLYVSSYPSSVSSSDSRSEKVYCLISQLAFLAPLLVQGVGFAWTSPLWAAVGNITCIFSFVTLLYTQNGFGFPQWASKRNRSIAIALVVAGFVISKLFSNPMYLNAFLTLFFLSALINLRDRRDFYQQKASLESIKSKLLTKDSKLHNEKCFDNEKLEKIRKI